MPDKNKNENKESASSESEVQSSSGLSITRKRFLKLGVGSIFAAGSGVALNQNFNLDAGMHWDGLSNNESGLDNQVILWPAIGHPAGLVAGDENAIWIYLHVKPGQVPALGNLSLSLSPVNSPHSHASEAAPVAEDVALQLLALEKANVKNKVNGAQFSSWTQKNTKHVYRAKISLNQSPEFAKSKNQLFDLKLSLFGESFIRPNSVFVSPPLSDKRTGNQQFLIASDTHVSSRWDQMEAEVGELFPDREKVLSTNINDLGSFSCDDFMTKDCFDGSWINPNRNFARFIASANELHDEGKVDALVLIGDIVDFKFKKEQNEEQVTYQDTEWSFLEAMLLGQTEYSERLRVPVFMTTGNHDYRLHPYTMQIYGIRHCGVAQDFCEEYLKRNGAYRTVKFNIDDLDSVRVDTGKRHSLNYYYRYFNPMDDFQVSFAGTQLVLMDTGPDFFTKQTQIFKRDWKRYLKELFDIAHADSIGFSSKQIKFFGSALNDHQAKVRALFTHAPILHSSADKAEFEKGVFEKSLDAVLPLKDFSYKTINQFESIMKKTDLDRGIIFKNKLPILQLLSQRKEQTVVMSGHTHRSIEFGVNDSTGEVCVGDYGKSEVLKHGLKDKTLYLVGGCLGHVERDRQEQNKPSFREMAVENGAIASIEKRTIDEAPFNKVFSHLILSSENETGALEDASLDSAELLFDFDPRLLSSRAEFANKVILAFKNDSGEFVSKPDGLQFELSSTPALHNSEEQSEVYLFENQQSLQIDIKGRPQGLSLVFAVEHFSLAENGYESLGFQRFQKELS